MNGDATTPSWYYAKAGAVDGQQVGPVSWEQLSSLAQTGALTAQDLVWNPQLPSWVTVAEVPGLLAPPPPRLPQDMPRPGVSQPTAVRPGAAARPGGVHPISPARQPTQPKPAYDSFLDEDEMDEFGDGGRSWLRWGIALGAIAVIAIVIGVYFGVIRGGTPETTTTLAPTTTLEVTTTTELPPITEAIWTDLAPLGDLPAARSAHSMAYDSVSGNIVLFGGWDANGTYNDTWVFDATLDTWTNKNPAGTLPAARAQHQMAYDPVSGKAILFGGVVAKSGEQLGDTWGYDPIANTWTDLDPAGDTPSPRDSFSMVYDQINQKIILFGGWSDETGAHLNDTWAYDPAANTWTNLNPTGDIPAVRGSHTMAYDPDDGKILLFGGVDGNAYFSDTWAYDALANIWTNLGPTGETPAGRAGHRMAYDPTSGTTILFGGWDGATYFNDTWAFNVASNTWTNLSPIGAAPSARDSHSLVYNAATDELILFGGLVGGASDAQDTWSYGMGELSDMTLPPTSDTLLLETTTTLGTNE